MIDDRDPPPPQDEADAPRMKVTDRRWWARGEGADGAASADEPASKPTYVTQLEQQLADKDRQLQMYAAKYRESSEEFEAARARMRRDVMKDVERSRRATLAEFLEVVDNLDRALDAARSTHNLEALLTGVDMVHAQFLSTLASFGVTPIASIGEPFDPARHEAAATVPTDDPTSDGVVVGVIKNGYALGEELLRPATVAVARLT